MPSSLFIPRSPRMKSLQVHVCVKFLRWAECFLSVDSQPDAGASFCPCVMWALLFHESQLHLLMISKWTRNWFQTFKSFKVLCNLQQISETVWRAFSPLELQVSSKNIFKNVVRYVRWFWFALSFWVNADEFVLSHPLERNNVLTCDSHFNMLVLIGCLLVICLFVCWQSTWMSIVRTWM